MIKIESAFHVAGIQQGAFTRGGTSAERHRLRAKRILLRDLSVSIKLMGKVYSMSSNQSPVLAASPFCGTAWPRWILPLTQGISIEQQMALPSAGDAVAISWRLIGRPLIPVQLTAGPLFSAGEVMAAQGFEIEAETNGGRLGWRPHEGSDKIIVDTNGRYRSGATAIDLAFSEVRHSSDEHLAMPAFFDFELGPHPAVLIFSLEPDAAKPVDPMIGGFLAELAERRSLLREYESLRSLAAA